jgi:hypothetical protein
MADDADDRAPATHTKVFDRKRRLAASVVSAYGQRALGVEREEGGLWGRLLLVLGSAGGVDDDQVDLVSTQPLDVLYPWISACSDIATGRPAHPT